MRDTLEEKQTTGPILVVKKYSQFLSLIPEEQVQAWQDVKEMIRRCQEAVSKAKEALLTSKNIQARMLEEHEISKEEMYLIAAAEVEEYERW